MAHLPVELSLEIPPRKQSGQDIVGGSEKIVWKRSMVRGFSKKGILSGNCINRSETMLWKVDAGFIRGCQYRIRFAIVGTKSTCHLL